MKNVDLAYRATADNRLEIADLLESLTPQQWQHPTLCDGWTVRTMAGHLVTGVLTGMTLPWLVRTLTSFRGDTDKAMDHYARRYALLSPDELVATLREHAHDRLRLPGVGPFGQMTDSFIHLRDIARPLDLEQSPNAEQWRLPLDFLASRRARAGFVPRGRLDGVQLEATDLEWTSGTGSLVRGTGESLAMAVAGRPDALPDLEGPGQPLLASRITS